MKRILVFAACLLFGLNLSHGVEFSTASVAGKRATVCRVDLRKERLELFVRDDAGQPFKSFDGVAQWLQPQGRGLLFAMNAGMYHANLAPVGLAIANGKQVTPLNLAKGEGNFFLKPNGVFLVSKSGARIVESSEYPALSEPASVATQSGPLLVRANKIHPAFTPGSDSRLIRNGVGVVSPQTVVFVLSEEPVSFYEFAQFFRDELHCPDALFLDGTVSSLYAPKLKRNDKKIDLGPILGITGEPDAAESQEPADENNAAQPKATPAKAGEIPDAIPEPGKPGFFRSPFAPDQGLIDARGMPPGTEVRDPYTQGKIFRLPRDQ